jgi:hypothetical protein
MKIKWLIRMLPVIAVAGAIAGFSGDETDYPGGSPAGYTGSPGDGKDCVQCHGGSSSTVDNWITSDIPAEGYTPGDSYTITVTVTGTGKKGFEVSPQDLAGNLLGTLAAGPSNELAGNGKYVTQSSGVNSNPAVWSFTWTAPDAGTGEVTFYGAFTVSEPVTKLSTLTVGENTAAPLTVQAMAVPDSIFKGDSAQLDAVAAGGSGNYSYTWISDPAGFTSTLKNPYVKPEVNTSYTVFCSDGVNTVNGTVDVAVQFHVGIALIPGISVSVVPNPATDNVQIRAEAEGLTTIRLADFSGRILYSRQVQPAFGIAETTLDVSGLPAGSYLLSVITAHAQTTRQIVVR